MPWNFASGLFGLALTLAPAFALANGWSATPWPSASADGTRYCYLGYAEEPASLLVIASNAYAGDFRISINAPAFGNAAEGGEVAFVFPSGWRVSVPFQLFAPGQFAVGLDEASFHRVLDELGTPGALEISAGGGRITIAVPDQLDGRIRNLRGPLPEGSPMTEPCLAQLAGG